MANLVLGYGDLVGAGTVTSGTAVPSLPATNVQDGRASVKWRATANTDYVLADLGSVSPVGWVAWSGLDLSLSGTRRIRLSGSDATGAAGDAHDSGTAVAGVDPAYGLLVYILPADVSGRYLRVDLADSAVTFLEGARLWAGPTFRPQTNFAAGLQDLLKDTSVVRQSEAGEIYADARPRQRGVTLSLPRVTTSEKNSFLDPLRRAAGLTGDVMVCKDPTSTNLGRDTIVGPLESVFAIPHQHFNWHTAEMTVWERR